MAAGEGTRQQSPPPSPLLATGEGEGGGRVRAARNRAPRLPPRPAARRDRRRHPPALLRRRGRRGDLRQRRSLGPVLDGEHAVGIPRPGEDCRSASGCGADRQSPARRPHLEPALHVSRRVWRRRKSNHRVVPHRPAPDGGASRPFRLRRRRRRPERLPRSHARLSDLRPHRRAPARLLHRARRHDLRRRPVPCRAAATATIRSCPARRRPPTWPASAPTGGTTAATPPFQRLLATTPYYAVWDDHEIANDSGPHDDPTPRAPGTHLLPIALRAFLDYQPLIPPADDPTRLYRSLRWGKHVELFLLDTRQYRDANAAPDRDAQPKTMLGAAQIAVARARARAPPTPPGRSSSPACRCRFPPADRRATASPSADTDTGFEHEAARIFRILRDAGIRNHLWITTDVHFATGFLYRPFADDPELDRRRADHRPAQRRRLPEPRRSTRPSTPSGSSSTARSRRTRSRRSTRRSAGSTSA